MRELDGMDIKGRPSRTVSRNHEDFLISLSRDDAQIRDQEK